MKRLPRPGLSTLILAGVILGIAAGLFFGEHVAFLSFIGDIFVGLLQMTVLPYITLALIANIGRLSSNEGRRFGLYASMFLLLSTALTLGAVMLLANNVVPAVVIFCIAVGLGVMTLPQKQAVLDQLDVVGAALARINQSLVKVTPIGVFAIVASTSGTMQLAELARLEAYLLIFCAGVFILGFGVMIPLISALPPGLSLSACRETAGTAVCPFFCVVCRPASITDPVSTSARHGALQHVREPARGDSISARSAPPAS